MTRHDRVIAEHHFVDDQANDTLSPKTFSASTRRRHVSWSRVRAELDNAHPLALSWTRRPFAQRIHGDSRT